MGYLAASWKAVLTDLYAMGLDSSHYISRLNVGTQIWSDSCSLICHLPSVRIC